LLDDVPELVDGGVELFLPVQQLATGRLAERGDDACAEVTFVTDGVVAGEDVDKPGVPDAFRVVGLAGQRSEMCLRSPARSVTNW